MKVRVTGFVCLLMTTVSASVGPPLDVRSRAKAAERVVVAMIVDVNSRFGTDRFGDQLIVSDVLLDISETMKGAHAPVATVTIEGGTVGDLTMRASDMPSFKPHDRAVFFLDRTPAGTLFPHDRGLGILRLDTENRVDNSDLTLADVRRQVQQALK